MHQLVGWHTSPCPHGRRQLLDAHQAWALGGGTDGRQRTHWKSGGCDVMMMSVVTESQPLQWQAASQTLGEVWEGQ